jgi:hypothetical protein
MPLPCPHCAAVTRCSNCSFPYSTAKCQRADCVEARKIERQDNKDYEAKVDKTQKTDSAVGETEIKKLLDGPVEHVYIPAQEIVPVAVTAEVETQEVHSCTNPLCKRCRPEAHLNVADTDQSRGRQHELLFDRVSVVSSREDRLRIALFGPGAAAAPKPKQEYFKLVNYPQILQISRSKLVELLDVPVTTEPRFTDQRVMKSTDLVTNRIAQIESERPALEARMDELKTLIKESENIIDGLSVRAMKIRRGKDEVLDKSTREKFKREESKKIDQYKVELKAVREQLDPERVTKLKERLDKWGDNPLDYEVKSVETQVPVLFRTKFVPPLDFEGPLPDGYDYGVDAYVQMVYHYDGTTDGLSVFKPWLKFENEIVLQGIRWGLIRPSAKLLKAHPSLEVGPSAKFQDVGTQDDIEADETENVLIAKTGGAAIGGGVYGGKGTRGLDSFDTFRPYKGGGQYGGGKPDNWLGGLDSGDLGERAGDE